MHVIPIGVVLAVVRLSFAESDRAYDVELKVKNASTLGLEVVADGTLETIFAIVLGIHNVLVERLVMASLEADVAILCKDDKTTLYARK